jgi:hypothetical protein
MLTLQHNRIRTLEIAYHAGSIFFGDIVLTTFWLFLVYHYFLDIAFSVNYYALVPVAKIPKGEHRSQYIVVSSN